MRRNNFQNESMMRSINSRDVIWGYIATGLNLSAGLILLPIVLHYLPSKDVGLWFVFITLASFAQILEVGFLSTLTRNTAYIYGGAQSLLHEGLSTEGTASALLNEQLLADLLAASRTIYRTLAILALIGLLGGGTLYLSTLMTGKQDAMYYYYSWWSFAFGYIVSLYYGYYTAILQGRGDIAKANKITTITRGSFLIIATVCLCLGFGLIGIGAASLLSCIIGRIFSISFYYDSTRPEVTNVRHMPAKPGRLIKIIWHNSSRLFLVAFSTFLIQRASILLATSFLGLEVTASYGMTLTILISLTGISTVFLQLHMPRMSTLQSQGDYRSIRVLLGETLIIGWSTYIILFILLLLFGEAILGFISTKASLLPNYQLLALGLIYFFELNSGISGGYLTTINRIPFVLAVFWSGIAIVLTGFFLLAYLDLGVWSLIIAQGAVQLSYNYWKWFTEAIRHVGGDLEELLTSGVGRVSLKLKH